MIENQLPELMKRKDISIRELSRLTGITYTTIRAVYHGQRRSVQLDVIDSICENLNIQPGDIYKYYQDKAAAAAASNTVADLPLQAPDLDKTDSKGNNRSSEKAVDVDDGWHVW